MPHFPSTPLLRLPRNPSGRDLIVGDVHGCFSLLREALYAVGFSPDAGDRLISVGDLVDRGPESDLAADWLAYPWFFAARGNHEGMAVRWGDPGCRMDPEVYLQNGGAWNLANPPAVRAEVADALASLPLAIELETAAGPVGVVHADCPFDDWRAFVRVLADAGSLSPERRSALEMAATWDRSRVEGRFLVGVAGVRAVVVGHTPVDEPMTLGNVIYLDTAAWWSRNAADFCLLDAATLRPVTAHVLRPVV